MDIIDFHTDEKNYVTSYDLGSWGWKISDVRYRDESAKNTMDIYIPGLQGKTYPVIFFLHSGGLCSGDKTRHLALMLQGLQLGYAVVSMNYRLTDETDLKGIYQDAVCAVHYLKRHAGEYNLNKDKIVYCGETHGIHIMTNLMIDAGRSELEELDSLQDGTDCSSCGAVLFYPVNHFTEMMENEDKEQKEVPNDQRKYIETAMFKGSNLKEVRRLAYDEHIHTENASENTPPLLIFHAMKDPVLSHRNSEKLIAEFWAKGTDASLMNLSHGRHSWREDKFVERETAEPMFAFIASCFGGR